MAKAKRKAVLGGFKEQNQEPAKEKPQKYDETLKNWITQEVDEIVPILVEGMQYDQELSIEFSRSMMRADKVFRVRYHGQHSILNVEFQVSADQYLSDRLLLYNAALRYKYHLPVISLVIYPFEVTMAVPPLIVANDEKNILVFNYGTMPLFLTNAESYVQNHQTCMYALLPAMLGFHADMAVQAMSELSERYRDDRDALVDQYVCMQLCLERTETIEA